MINAEVIIDDIGSWNATTKAWDYVQFHVNYPLGPVNGIVQNRTNNPASNNDIIVDRTGKIWKISNLSVVSVLNNSYTCTLTDVLVIPSTSSRVPDAYSTKNLLITPNANELLSPYFHDSTISTLVFRAAMAYNMDKMVSI